MTRAACVAILIGLCRLAAADAGAEPTPAPATGTGAGTGAAPGAAGARSPATSTAAPKRGPWRMAPALGSPAWVRVELEHLLRFEHLADDFRADAEGDVTALSLRTVLLAEVTSDSVRAGVEIEDSRVFASDGLVFTTALVNPVELLQAYVGGASEDALREGDHFDVRLGRITLDLGSRRLVSRNLFRNTINGFTGVDATWTSPAGHGVRGFAVLPVTRLPDEAARLKDLDVELDEENSDALLWAAAYATPMLAGETHLEAFVLGFHERDGELATRDRQLVTGSLRWFRKPAPGQLDFEVEVMPQVGTAHATTAADDTASLGHRALSTHAELGIRPDVAWRPRLAVQHDYASGDLDPDDDSLERFDPLFGSRRFELGPTGIYGPFLRSNMHSPGLRISFAPSATIDAVAGYRLHWLASRRDAWIVAGLRDPSGGSGRYVGELAEGVLRWHPLGPNLTVEGGGAYLRRGTFARTAPGGRPDPSAYVYAQLVLLI